MQENCICLGTFHRTSQKIPKTVQQPQQRPELPETKWEFTFLQLWNNKREKSTTREKIQNDKQQKQWNEGKF